MAWPFKGKIGLRSSDSVKDFPKGVEASEGAPNILLILTDANSRLAVHMGYLVS
ncbi:MAG TPA: hypothetical protein VJ692_06140 [Nitrospiraceae bacterium]|nr:hypothetical protein [Nitrospiraceae bacterium]